MFKILFGDNYFSDSLSFSDIRDKTAMEKLCEAWCFEIPELSGMRKADRNALKSFLSSAKDVYRPAYGRIVKHQKRQCVFLGTTNETNFLQDPTGNRRFWVVPVSAKKNECEKWNITEEERQQIWAEAMHYYRAKEQIYLPPELEEIAEQMQDVAHETDDRTALIQNYIEMPIPSNWNNLETWQRYKYFIENANKTALTGDKRQYVSAIEIYVECFGFTNNSDLANFDLRKKREIGEMLQNLGWRSTNKQQRIKPYGSIRVWAKQ